MPFQTFFNHFSLQCFHYALHDKKLPCDLDNSTTQLTIDIKHQVIFSHYRRQHITSLALSMALSPLISMIRNKSSFKVFQKKCVYKRNFIPFLMCFPHGVHSLFRMYVYYAVDEPNAILKRLDSSCSLLNAFSIQYYVRCHDLPSSELLRNFYGHCFSVCILHWFFCVHVSRQLTDSYNLFSCQAYPTCSELVLSIVPILYIQPYQENSRNVAAYSKW